MNSKLSFSLVLLIAVLVAVLLAGCSDQSGPRQENVAQVAAQASPQIPKDEPVALVASQVGPSVVQVNVKVSQNTPFGRQSAEGVGSGVIYRKDGYIITNNHVVQGARQVNVAFASTKTNSPTR